MVIFDVCTFLCVSVIDGTVTIAVSFAVGICSMFSHGATVVSIAIIGVALFGVACIVVAVISIIGHADVGSRVMVVGVVTIMIDTLIVVTFGSVVVWVVAVGVVLVFGPVGIAAVIHGLVVGAKFVVIRFVLVSCSTHTIVVAAIDNVSMWRGCLAGSVR